MSNSYARNRDIHRAVRRKMNREERLHGNKTTADAPGFTYYFGKLSQYLGRKRNVAKFLPAAPFVNGVRMRYEKGKLVPRVQR